MANYLGAVLEGLNQGVNTGLDLYKTVQSEARAKRQEQYTLKRDAIMDQRYEEGVDYQKQRDTLAQANNERDFAFREKTQAAADKRAEAAAAAAERRHQETMALTRSRMEAANRRAGAKIQQASLKETRAQVQALVGEGDDEGFKRVLTAVNSDPNIHSLAVHAAREAGFNVPDDVVGRLRVVPAGAGHVTFAVADEGGQLVPYDPDGPGGQTALVLPSTQFMAVMGGGKNGVAAAEVATARNEATGAARTLSGAIEAQAAPLGSELERQKKTLAGAQFANELATAGPRANFIAQQEEARANAEVNQWDGTRSYVDPATGKQVIEAAGMPGSIGGTTGLTAAKQEQEQEAAKSLASLADAERRVDVTQQRLEALPEQAKQIDQSWAQVESSISTLPAGERQAAYDNSKRTFAKDPALAMLFPGKDPKEAGDLALKERTSMVDSIVSKLDPTTLTADGKVASLKGYKAGIEATLLSMPHQVQMALRDPSGQMKGALIKAANTAAQMGKPEAIVYLLQANARNLPAEEAIRLMEDPAISREKDPGKRYAMAERALEMVARGEADTPVAALGHVIQGR